MQGKVVCIGSADERTFPRPWRRENGRVYYWAGPGVILHWTARAGEPIRKSSNLPYGLLLIDDLMIREDDPIQREVTMRDTFLDGTERAKDLARRWNHLGAIYAEGEGEPTAEQIKAAKARRALFAERQLHVAIRSVEQNRAGRMGKADYDASDEGWAAELGREIPRTFQKLPQAQTEEGRIPCPECREPIMPGANRCRFCHAKLKPGWEVVNSVPSQQEFDRKLDELEVPEPA